MVKSKNKQNLSLKIGSEFEHWEMIVREKGNFFLWVIWQIENSELEQFLKSEPGFTFHPSINPFIHVSTKWSFRIQITHLNTTYALFQTNPRSSFLHVTQHKRKTSHNDLKAHKIRKWSHENPILIIWHKMQSSVS